MNDGGPEPCVNDQLQAIRERLNQEQAHDGYYHGSSTTLETLARILDHKRNAMAATIDAARRFQEDVLTFLRAFELMLETVASASTHGEKAARLRGLMELVGTAARRVRDRQFKEMATWSHSMADDIFRCDYPVRHWIDKAKDAETRAERAEQECRTVRELWAPKPTANTQQTEPDFGHR